MKPQIISEELYIIEKFKKNFYKKKKEKIVIYGIGKNTKIILDNFSTENIIGLMDYARTGETIYGKRIISLDEALVLGVTTIIIVARASNVKIIYRRIAEACIKNFISVCDINGTQVEYEAPIQKSFEKYININEQLLRKKIDESDIVSFDVFDTLIMRSVLYPHDVFDLIEEQVGNDFAKKRISAETMLYRNNCQPNIQQIYQQLDGFSEDMEIESELKYAVIRSSMVEMLKYAILSNKPVYLVSDMYLNCYQIKNILDKLNVIVNHNQILVSCDYGVSKATGLFEVLRKVAGSGKILHIGDNYEADISSAIRYGIDDTFHINSAVTMLEDSYAYELLKKDNTLANRLIIGKFISRQLNSPFLFSRTKGKFEVDSNFEMGYTFISPLIVCFFGWLVDKAKLLNLDRILLSARDGLIIYKVYKSLLDKIPDLPLMEYFYTSRAVCVLAGIKNDDDILHAARLAYSGTVKDMLKHRFNLNDNEILSNPNLCDDDYILLHRESIMSHAEICRKHYCTYVENHKIQSGEDVGFFDFVSSGTCQKGLDNFLDFHLYGLYFAAVNSEANYKSEVVIDTMFGMFNVFEKSYNILENYFFLENIMTSDEPTLCGFDVQGLPEFSPEKRTEKQLDTLNQLHDAIVEYVKDSQIDMKQFLKVDPIVPDLIIKFLLSQFTQLNTNYFKENQLEDEFCNRTFNLFES